MRLAARVPLVLAIVVLLSMLFVAGPGRAQSQDPVVVRIAPASSQVATGATVDVTAEVVDVVDLYGFDVTVTRVFLKNGAEVKRQAFHTTYIPEDEVICGPDPSKTPGATPRPNGGGPETGSPSRLRSPFVVAGSAGRAGDRGSGVAAAPRPREPEGRRLRIARHFPDSGGPGVVGVCRKCRRHRL